MAVLRQGTDFLVDALVEVEPKKRVTVFGRCGAIRPGDLLVLRLPLARWRVTEFHDDPDIGWHARVVPAAGLSAVA